MNKVDQCSSSTITVLALAFSFGCTVGDARQTDAATNDADAGADSQQQECPGHPSCPVCSNGVDDDGDSRVDYPLDPGCRDPDDTTEEEAVVTECNDGMDNDGDGFIDYPHDLGCEDERDSDETDPPPSLCSNGADDDGDGLADFPDDPGCADAVDNDEADECPGEDCPACADRIDNDGDGFTDYPADVRCVSASDPSESCAILADFDGEEPTSLRLAHGAPAELSRNANAAHDGPFGMSGDSGGVLLVPELTVGDGGQASIWTRTLDAGHSFTNTTIVFAADGSDHYGCQLDHETGLSLRDNAEEVLGSAALSVDSLKWYRLEVQITEIDAVRCTVYDSDGLTALVSLTMEFDEELRGGIGIKQFGGQTVAGDTFEVCP